jgi:hypothetical protein
MKKFFLLLLVTRLLGAREIFLPPTLYRSTIIDHEVPETFDDSRFDWQAWSIFFDTTASRALIDAHSQSLATLIFGKPSFALQEAFAGATVNNPANPFLSLTVNPRARFHARGALIGMQARYRCTSRSHIGARITVPVQQVSFENRSATATNPSPLGGQNSNAFFIFDQETVDGISMESFAFRMDMLSRLPADCQVTNYSLVNYSDALLSNNISMVDQDVTNNPVLSIYRQNPVFVTLESAAVTPTPPFAQTLTASQALPCLSANGSSITPGNAAHFCNGTVYTPLASQSTLLSNLWLMPAVDTVHGGLATPAAVILDRVQNLLSCAGSTAEAVFTNCGMNFNSHEHTGLGDARMELFAQYAFNSLLYGEPSIIVLLPTETHRSNARGAFDLPLGNNGHAGLGLGAFLHLDMKKVMNANFYIGHVWVLPAREMVAAPFTGATIKNLGPSIPARVSWQYEQVDAWLTLNPHWGRNTLALSLGYQLYHKDTDRIDLYQANATDCLGSVASLNRHLLSKGTGVIAHTIWAEADYQYCSRKFTGAITVRFSRVVRGDYAPKEQGLFVGFTWYRE